MLNAITSVNGTAWRRSASSTVIPAAVVKIAAPAIIPTIIGMVISTRWRRKWNLDAVRPASPDRMTVGGAPIALLSRRASRLAPARTQAIRASTHANP
jgi:hypothetical protein